MTPDDSTGLSWTFEHNIPVTQQFDPAIVYCIAFPQNADVTGATLNGEAITFVRQDNTVGAPSYRRAVAMFVAPRPPQGDVVLNVTMSSGLYSGAWAGFEHYVAGMFFTGVNPTTPINLSSDAGANAATTTTATVDVTTTTDNAWVIDCADFATSPALNPGAGQTERVDESITLGIPGDRLGVTTEGPVSPAGTVTMSQVRSSGTGYNVIVAAELVPAPDPAGLNIVLDGSVSSSVGPGFVEAGTPDPNSIVFLPADADEVVLRDRYQVVTNKILIEPVIVDPAITGFSSPSLWTRQTASTTSTGTDEYFSFDLEQKSGTEPTTTGFSAPVAMTFSNLSAGARFGSGTSCSYKIQLRKNGANCGLNCTLNMGTGTNTRVTCADNYNTCTVAAGDYLTWFGDESGTCSGEPWSAAMLVTLD